MRRLALVLGLSLALAASGGAATAFLSQSGKSPTPTPKKSAQNEVKEAEEEPGVHGGPIDRFHNPSSCNLVDVSKLAGNWTHGDYVSAVVQAGDPSLVPQAAHSDCGKPLVAANHGAGARGPSSG